MALSNYSQFNLLISSLIGGIITGILFDIYRAIRGNEIPNKIIVFFEDILFWVLMSIIIFAFLLHQNGAIINTYSYAFMIIGTYMYFKFFSRRLLNYEIIILDTISRNLRIILNAVLYPFRLIINHFFSDNKNK